MAGALGPPFHLERNLNTEISSSGADTDTSSIIPQVRTRKDIPSTMQMRNAHKRTDGGGGCTESMNADKKNKAQGGGGSTQVVRTFDYHAIITKGVSNIDPII